MRTLGQKRAEFALRRVLEATAGLDKKSKEEFANFTAGAPSMILQNGFGQALAFWFSKGKDNVKYMTLFRIIMDWLSYDNRNDIKNNFVPKTEKPSEFLEELSKMDQKKYLTAQKESLALLEWIKRFAKADL